MPTLPPRSHRLILRHWSRDDREALAQMHADPAVMEFLMPIKDRAASDAVAERAEAHFAQHDFGLWVVELPGITPFAGYTGLVHVPYEAHFTPAVEIGWRFLPAYWGCGYATEAARLCLGYGFESLQLEEIIAITTPMNDRSRNVMERLGMSHTSDDDFDYPPVPAGHRLSRQVLYRLRRDNFLKSGASPKDRQVLQEHDLK